MVSERNRILKIANYIESCGISVNLGKTKARGNKGIFIRKLDILRIDIAPNLSEDAVLSILVHEFAHYVHYLYDRSLKSLDFIFETTDDSILEELRKVTVDLIPKDFALELFNKKDETKKEIKLLTNSIKNYYPDFLSTKPFLPIEKRIKRPVKYLLSYDNVRFFNTLYSVKNIDSQFDYLEDFEKNYIKLKSKKRLLNRINSRINRLNKYYNNPTELFARFMEKYFLDRDYVFKKAPISASRVNSVINSGKIKELTGLFNLFKENLYI